MLASSMQLVARMVEDAEWEALSTKKKKKKKKKKKCHLPYLST